MAQETEEGRIVRLETKLEAMEPMLAQVAEDVTAIRLSLAKREGAWKLATKATHFLVGIAGVLVGHLGHNWITGGK